jgi:hypothetical protein
LTEDSQREEEELRLKSVLPGAEGAPSPVFLEVLILKSFKFCVLEVRILKGLRVCFGEVRILRELVTGEW